jgi:elongation factor P
MAVLPSLNSIRVGTQILLHGEPCQVLSANFMRCQQRKPVMQTKLRNLVSGKVIEVSFKPGDRIEEADLEKKWADYLYSDDRGIYFMDSTSYEQVALDHEIFGEQSKLLKEGTQVEILYFNDKPISANLPPKINLKVTSAPPGIKGDSAGSVTKQITLETGLVINAPLFIKEGDVVRINTDTIEYVERA